MWFGISVISMSLVKCKITQKTVSTQRSVNNCRGWSFHKTQNKREQELNETWIIKTRIKACIFFLKAWQKHRYNVKRITIDLVLCLKNCYWTTSHATHEDIFLGLFYNLSVRISYSSTTSIRVILSVWNHKQNCVSNFGLGSLSINRVLSKIYRSSGPEELY